MKPETTDQWLRRIGSLKAMEERQRLRLDGKINQPIPRGHDSGTPDIHIGLSIRMALAQKEVDGEQGSQ